MANKCRGETEFTAGGKTYTFRVGTNEMVDLEAKLGVVNILKAFSDGKVGMAGLRTLAQIGLSRHHKDLSEEEAGDIVDEIGGFKKITEMMACSLAEIRGEPVPKPEAAGTGPVSSPQASAQG